MKNNASLLYSFFLIVSDTITLIAAFVAAYVLRVTLNPTPLITPVPSRTYFTIMLALIPAWIIIFGLLGLYNRNTYEKRFGEIGRLFIGTIIGILFIIALEYFSNDPIFPAKMVPIYATGLTFILLVISRNIVRKIRQILFRYKFGVSNVLIVGNTAAATELIAWLGNPEISGYKIIGTVGGHKKGSLRHFATFSEATKALGKKRIDSIMQTELFLNPEMNDEILSFAQNNHVAYRFVPGNSELFVGNIDVELFQSSIPMIAVHQTALFGWGRILKRLFDLIVGLPIFIISLPIMLVITLLYIFDHGDPVFKQNRSSRFGRTIHIYKFRTMKHAYNGITPEQSFAKMGRPELAKAYRKNGDFLENDPRVSRLGRFLRKTSLDELPQIFNVMKGDLSLVGPRPLEPFEMEQYSKKHLVLSVKPGLTGLAVVSGRRNISFDERRQLDTFYAQNWSFWLDIVILLKTIRVVLSGKGAK